MPPPTVVTVYELTEAGRALGPALDSLRQWGARYGTQPSPEDVARPSWVLMSAASRPTGLPEGPNDAPGTRCANPLPEPPGRPNGDEPSWPGELSWPGAPT